MIDTATLRSIMEEYPEFSYELNPVPETSNVELLAERDNKFKSGGGYRKIRKIFQDNEDVGLLRKVLQGRED